MQPLLLKSSEKEEDEEVDDEFDASEEASEESRLPAKSLGSAYRLLTPSVKVLHGRFQDSYSFLKLKIYVLLIKVILLHS